MKTNILFISHTSKMGGGENSLYYLVRGLDREIFNPIVVCPSKGELTEKLRAINVEIEIIKQPSFLNNNFFKLSWQFGNTIKEIRKVVKKRNIDLIHANSIRSSIYSAFAVIGKEIPTISHIRVTDFGTNKVYELIAAKLLNFNDKIIVVSEAVKQKLLNLNTKLDKKIVKIYNGIDLSEFDLSSCYKVLRNEYGFSENDILVGMVGRFAPWKGHRYFIDAASKINNKNTKFIIVGDVVFEKNKEYKNEMINLSINLGISKKIIFTGYRSDIPDIMSDLDIFVLPSDEEPFGRVVIEAMAAKTPVIATKLGGPLEIIDSGSGILVEPKNSNALAKEINNLINSKQKRVDIGLKARERVENMFSLESHINEIQKFYLKLIS
jgi:glycosyltransferase involved in cell wall biosynthesis